MKSIIGDDTDIRMNKTTKVIQFISLLTGIAFIVFSNKLLAVDIVKFEAGQSQNDARMAYKIEVIQSALEHTKDTYGPYLISTSAPLMNSLQAMRQLQNGELLNVFIALTNKDWESNTIPIRIPLRRGLLSYRLLLTHKRYLPLLKNVNDVSDLMSLQVGLRHNWSITKILSLRGFDIVPSKSYEGLFAMLNSQRFHYIPRGINEIYNELDSRKSKLNNVVIEPKLVLYIPSPTYLFVSPKYPRLAQRFEDGLELMVANGTLKAIFDNYFTHHIERADIKNRRIIVVDNPLLPELTPLERSELWWSP